MALIELKVPDIGDFDEVEVIELLVSAGQQIKPEQSLLTVESDKASMEIPSSAAGRVVELKVGLGDKVAQGSVIALVETADAMADQPSAAANAVPPTVPVIAPVIDRAAGCSRTVCPRRRAFTTDCRPREFARP